LKVLYVPASVPSQDEPILGVDGPQLSDFPNLDIEVRVQRGTWREIVSRTVELVDGVIVIGGAVGRGTDWIAQETKKRLKSLLPIPVFGGAAAKVWDTEARCLRDAGISQETTDLLSRSFDVKLVVGTLEQLVSARKSSRQSPESGTSTSDEIGSVRELFAFLRAQYRPSGKLEESFAVKLMVEHLPNEPILKTREGLSVDRTITFLKLADAWLSSANRDGEESEALIGAAFVYSAIVDAIVRPDAPWGPLHDFAYGIFARVLDASFHLRLRLDSRAKRRFFDHARKISESPLSGDDLGMCNEVEALVVLMKEYVCFITR